MAMLKRLESIQTSKNVYGYLDLTSLKYALKEKEKKIEQHHPKDNTYFLYY